MAYLIRSGIDDFYSGRRAIDPDAQSLSKNRNFLAPGEGVEIVNDVIILKMKVEAIMTKEVISVHADATVAEIAHILFERNLTGVPVIEQDGAVIGIITEYDLMSRNMAVHIPTYVRLLESLEGEQSGTRMMDEMEAIRRTTARAIMTAPVVTLWKETTVDEAARIFSEAHINPLPVVDEQGKLAGIVSRSDIVKLFRRKN